MSTMTEPRCLVAIGRPLPFNHVLWPAPCKFAESRRGPSSQKGPSTKSKGDSVELGQCPGRALKASIDRSGLGQNDPKIPDFVGWLPGVGEGKSAAVAVPFLAGSYLSRENPVV
jgi:hypothetical protein